MSKKSRRRNQVLGVIAGLMGAKALGVLGNKTAASSGASKIVGKTPEFRKSFVKPKIKTPPTTTSSVVPKLKVDSTGNVFKNGVNKGVGNKKTLFVNRDPNVGSIGIYKGGKKVSGLNQKAINVLSDGKIQTKGVTYPNKKAYSEAMKAARMKNKISLKGVTDFGLTDMGGAKKGKMIKARGGGMAKTKPTKMY